MAEKKSTMLLWLAGALVLLLYFFSRRPQTSSSGLATFAAPGAGGPAASANGNIIAGITGLLRGFQNGATATAASNPGNATGGATYAGIAYGAPGSQSYGVAQALATQQAGGETPLFPALGGSSAIPAPVVASNPNAPDLSFLGANNGPALPGQTATNDLLNAPAVTTGGGSWFSASDSSVPSYT